MKERGAASILILVVVVGIGLFIIPLITTMTRMDNVTQQQVNKIVEEFATDVQNTGKITQEKYQEFESKLSATGNVYNIDMELKILDENPGKKVTQANYEKIGENGYYAKYTTQVLQELFPDNGSKGEISLKEGDRLYVAVSIENDTPADTIKDNLLGSSSEGGSTIEADTSVMITSNGTGK